MTDTFWQVLEWDVPIWQVLWWGLIFLVGFGVDILKGLTMGTYLFGRFGDGTYLFGRFGDGDVPFWQDLGWERTSLAGFRMGT